MSKQEWIMEAAGWLAVVVCIVCWPLIFAAMF